MFSLTRKNFLRTAGILALVAAATAPDTAHAASDRGFDKETFDNSEKVTDKELSKMRGGFIGVNGLMIDFNFLSFVQVGLDVQQNVNINADNLAQAAMTAQQVQALIEPTIIQNATDNTLISIQQALEVNLAGGMEAINQLAQMQQLEYLQSIAK